VPEKRPGADLEKRKKQEKENKKRKGLFSLPPPLQFCQNQTKARLQYRSTKNRSDVLSETQKAVSNERKKNFLSE
jgi:hypothetical protein